MIRKHRFFSVLSLLSLFSPGIVPDGGGNPKPTLEDQLKSAKDELKNAKDESAKITGERDKAAADLQSAQDENKKLTSQFDELTRAANSTKDELTKVNGQLATITGERDKAQKDLTAATENLTRLEQLCSIKGIDPKSAVTQATPPEATLTVADFNTRLAAAKTPAEQTKILNEFAEAARAGKVARAD